MYEHPHPLPKPTVTFSYVTSGYDNHCISAQQVQINLLLHLRRNCSDAHCTEISCGIGHGYSWDILFSTAFFLFFFLLSMHFGRLKRLIWAMGNG